MSINVFHSLTSVGHASGAIRGKLNFNYMSQVDLYRPLVSSFCLETLSQERMKWAVLLGCVCCNREGYTELRTPPFSSRSGNMELGGRSLFLSQVIIFAVVRGHEDKSEFMLCGKGESSWDSVSEDFSVNQPPSGQSLAVHMALGRKGACLSLTCKMKAVSLR